VAWLHSADIQSKLKDINDYISKEYRLNHPKKKRDWRTFDQQFTRRAGTAMKMLNPLVHEAASAIQIVPAAGHPHSISLEDRLKLLLIKQLMSKSNRVFSNMLFMFSMLAGIEVSYKTIERLYSDPEVMLAVHNLHVLLLRKKGVNSSYTTGDGTGYSLTVKKNMNHMLRSSRTWPTLAGKGESSLPTCSRSWTLTQGCTLPLVQA
jgi:hypothetical protein